MKRRLLAGLALLGPVLAVAGLWLWLYRPGLPEAARPALTFYLAARAQAGGPAVRVSQLQLARNPGALTASLSAATYGDGSYFAVQHALGNVRGGGERALPYPPDEVWCAALTPATPAVTVIAKHMDLYKAAWVVHELPAALSPATVAEVLTRLGCPLTP